MKHIFWIIALLHIQKTHSVGCARREWWSIPLPHCAPRPMILSFPLVLFPWVKSRSEHCAGHPFPPEHGTHFHTSMGLFLSQLLCRYSGFATLIRMAIKFKKVAERQHKNGISLYISYYFLLGGFVTA